MHCSVRLKWFEIATVGGLSLLAIVTLFTRLNLNTDSSSYITAATNYARTGKLFIYTNAPSFSMSPEVERFTEQPPGFPLYIAPFIAVFRDPIISALIAQSVAITFYYIAIYLMTIELRLGLLLKIQALLLAATLEFLRNLQTNVLSEVLFLALSFIAGALSLRILRGAKKRMSYFLLIISLASASSLRVVGLANIVWVFPLVSRETVRELYRLLTKRSVGYGLVSIGLLFIALSASVDILVFSREPNIGRNQLLGLILGFTVLFTGLFGLFRNEKLQRFKDESKPSYRNRSQAIWTVGVLVATIAPVFIWFLSNLITFGQFNRDQRTLEVFNLGNLSTPFQVLWSELFNTWLGPSIIVVVVSIGLWVISYIRGLSEERQILGLLIAVTLAHFTVVWMASLFADFETIGPRYLSPAALFGAISTLYAIQMIYNSVRPTRWRYGLLILPAVFLVLGKNTGFGSPELRNLKINFPIERQLWREIRDIEHFDRSTHFYSDRIYEHQIFAGMPQRIFWDYSWFRDPALLSELLSRGERPFILMSTNSSEADELAEMLATAPIELSVIEFPELGYVLYFQGE